MASSKLVIAIVVSVGLHALLVAGAIWGWNQSAQTKTIKPPPNVVQAKLVKLKPQSKKKAAPPKKKKVNKIDLQAKRKEQARRKQAEEKKRQATIAKKKAEEKKKQEDLAKEQARKKKEALEREKREKEQQRQAAIDQEFEDMLREEEQMMLEEQYATEAQSYIALIQQRISNKFVPPPSARKGMETKVAIQLVPTGRVVAANVVDGSGNAAFDRAARQAVLDVEEFAEVKDMPPEVFERYFRNFSVIVKPQGLRL